MWTTKSNSVWDSCQETKGALCGSSIVPLLIMGGGGGGNIHETDSSLLSCPDSVLVCFCLDM